MELEKSKEKKTENAWWLLTATFTILKGIAKSKEKFMAITSTNAITKSNNSKERNEEWSKEMKK